MPFLGEPLFRRSGTPIDASSSTVVTDPRAVIDYDRLVVNIVHNRDVYVGDRAVVAKVSAIPISALIAFAGVAEAVIDPAVKSDVRTPVAIMPTVGIPAPSPVTGSPEISGFRSFHPSAWHPVVAVFVGVAPVAGGPDVSVAGTDRLCVNREGRRCDRDRHKNACE
jgi:hypothetical protein